ITDEAVQALMKHDWPGNVRELENAIERAVVMAQGGIITSQHLYLTQSKQRRFVDLDARLQGKQSLPEIMVEVEKQLLQQALVRSDSNQDEAAKLLRLEPSELQAKLTAYGIEA
ncbi:MAG TPA: helix-turn-helix domain-containing protein, partial [Chloroflexota bacterium]